MSNFSEISTVTDGTKLIADGGFTCIRQGEVLTAKADAQGHLYVPCNEGKHYLDGQADKGHYIGLSHPSA